MSPKIKILYKTFQEVSLHLIIALVELQVKNNGMMLGVFTRCGHGPFGVELNSKFLKKIIH
ncbi:hypothetical protein CJ263_04000 [Maribacter cobaltidurans]|uniref:Uncharacterized protein n=1 Tax=Maribacter cobaltidurans TaxID=1178778 RepID=A0A223V246_9FLAO|nr:hypothetical protein CJ263_04000 [Maribacter cobaltidurans]